MKSIRDRNFSKYKNKKQPPFWFCSLMCCVVEVRRHLLDEDFEENIVDGHWQVRRVDEKTLGDQGEQIHWIDRIGLSSEKQQE